ncbi:MAG: RNA pseudouridine synthase [Gammaproteobacteria bacterium]|nr:MAG: RNA pseudouridine synthase [Gammaproteobacteria bacterium]
MPPFEKHVDILESNQTAISILAITCPDVSIQKLKLAMQYGAVWLTPSEQSAQNKTQRIRRAKKTLKEGDKLHLYFNETILFSPITPAELISDEGQYSVWNKPSGMFSQGTKWGDHNSIARWVELFGLEKNKLEKRATFLVHRLDRATSGLIIVSHSKNATRLLTHLFESRQVEKKYQAFVKGEFPQSLVLKEITEQIDGKNALSIILSSSYNTQSQQSSLLVQIKTGRKHQIRKHLAGLGFPVAEDRLYGQSSCNNLSDLKLQSCYLEFTCPLTHSKKNYSLS